MKQNSDWEMIRRVLYYMKKEHYLFYLFIFLSLVFLVNCGNKYIRKCRKYSDEIWTIIPEKEKEIFNHLSDEDALSTYTLIDIKWGEAIKTDPNADPDETLLNSATSAKYLSMDKNSQFQKTHLMPMLYAKYYKKQYEKTGEHKYLDKILVIADHLRQNRDFSIAPISELRTLLYYLEALVNTSENDLKKMGYNKQEINELFLNMQKKYKKL